MKRAIFLATWPLFFAVGLVAVCLMGRHIKRCAK